MSDRYYFLGFHLLIIIINTIWVFRYYNIYWWSFYILYIAFLLLWLICNKNLYIHANLYLDTKWFIIFILIGVVSIVLNLASIVDGIYVIGLRIIPLLSIYQIYSLFSRYKVKDNKVIKNTETLFIYIYIAQLIVASFQFAVLGYTQDNLVSISGNAHVFSFITVFLGFYFYLLKENKIYLILFICTIVLVVMADFKMGLIIFIVSIFLAKIIIEGKVLRYMAAFAVMVVSIILLFPVLIPYLPDQYTIFYNIPDLKKIFVLSTPFPPNLELLKGYIQIFVSVFNDISDFLFGVGPGNYGTNISSFRDKELYREFISKYRQILDSEGVIRGTLLTRSNALINLITEFGIIGAVVYFITLIQILFSNKFYESFTGLEASGKSKEISMFYLILIIYFLLSSIFISPFEEGIYISFIAIFGTLVCIHRKIDLNGKKIIIYHK